MRLRVTCPASSWDCRALSLCGAQGGGTARFQHGGKCRWEVITQRFIPLQINCNFWGMSGLPAEFVSHERGIGKVAGCR